MKTKKPAKLLRVNLSRDDLDSLAKIAQLNGFNAGSKRMRSQACRFAIRHQANNLRASLLSRMVLRSVARDDTAGNETWAFFCDAATRRDLSKIKEFHGLSRFSEAVRFAIRQQAKCDAM